MNSDKNNFEESGIFNYIEQEKIRSSRVPHALAIAASTVIILAGIQAASGLLGPMLLALFLAIILLVPLRWLQDHGCPQLLAFLLVLFCTIVLFIGIIYVVSKSLTDEIGKIPDYRDRFVTKYTELEEQLKEWGFVIGELKERILPEHKENPDEEILDEETPDDPAPPDESVSPLQVPPPPPVVVSPPNTDAEFDPYTLESFEFESGINEDDENDEEEDDDPISIENIPTPSPEATQKWIQEVTSTEELPSLTSLDPQSVAFWITRVMLYLRNMLEGGFLVLIFTIFMLFEASYFPAKVNRAFGQDGPIRIEHFHRIAEDVRRYLFLKTLANLMSGSAAMFVYYMFGVPAWFFWGIVAFFMYYIPNVGGTLAAVIPGILILTIHGIPGVLLYAVCLVTIECAIAYGIEPKILGHGLRLSTLVIILSLFFWGFLLGAIGLFLAAPLTVMTKIILQAFPETRWLAIFLDGGRDKH